MGAVQHVFRRGATYWWRRTYMPILKSHRHLPKTGSIPPRSIVSWLRQDRPRRFGSGG
jgi:hypothetical protein